jgi:transcriptional regulator with GAF, ATPase, and Fis domain
LNADSLVPDYGNGAEQALFEATLALTRRLSMPQTCAAMLDAVQRIFEAGSCWVLLHDPDRQELVTIEARGQSAFTFADAHIPASEGIVGLAFRNREPLFVPDAHREERWFYRERIHGSPLTSVLTVPLVIEGDVLGVVGLESPKFTANCPPTTADIGRLRALAAIAAAGIKNANLLEAVEADRARLRRLVEERRQLKSYMGQLREEVREWHSPDHLIGESPIFREVLTQVHLVAGADSTVLLVGETGTGKELIARALHEQSRRAGKPFVAVNCAALPESLVESELFGYERGAFTGALSRKPGKFELADAGTLFLDEIGDLPAQAQAKLLRVLQEREVQRVGGTRPVPVNVRLISATNQDLGACMQSGEFRQDLYYRLSVFPIRVPPLRERTRDIPILVTHFLRRYADRLHKPVPRLDDDVLEQLVAYDWPGNVRELQNVIERAVILASHSVIGMNLIMLRPATISETRHVDVQLAEAHSHSDGDRDGERDGDNVIRFADAERHAIARALELSGWRISGFGGAAEILGLKPTTLHAKMKRLGIHRPGVSHARARAVLPS